MATNTLAIRSGAREVRSVGVPHWIRSAVPWLVGGVSLWWVARGFDFHVLYSQVANLHWGWVALAILFDVLTYVSQAARWKLLLRPVGNLSVWKATQAVYVGLFANEVLPLRVGEAVRAFLAAKWLGGSVRSVLPSILVERFLDGVWLAVGMALTAEVLPLPPMLSNGFRVLCAGLAVVLAVFGGLALLARKRPHARKLHGLRTFELTRTTAGAAVLSFTMLGFQAVSFWMAMRSCGVECPLWAGAAALVILRLGTLIPAAPANVGTYQFFCVLALTLLGIDRNTATSFSVLVFLMLTVPLWAFGLGAMLGTGVSFNSLRRSRYGADESVTL